MIHSASHGRGNPAPPDRDFTLFHKALLMEPLMTDALITRIWYDSAGGITFGKNTYLRMGRLASAEQSRLTSRMEPKAEFRALADSMLRVRFDIEKEVVGTGSPFMLFRTNGGMSEVGLQCIFESLEGAAGTATMVIWTYAEIIREAHDALARDPVFAAALPLALFGLGERGVSLSMNGTIAAICDGRHTEIVIR